MNDLLPPSATSQERAIALTCGRVTSVPSPLRLLWNPATCPLDILPWLAWALSVDSWNADWPESTKRAVVSAAIPTAKAKGTKQSVRDALAAISASSVIVEWFEKAPAGNPYTFTINIAAQDTSLSAQALMLNEINRTKPLRAHYEIIFGAASMGQIGIAGAIRTAIFTRLDAQSTY